MNHGVAHKYLDDCESSGPRPPVPGQESRLFSNMTEDYRCGGGIGGGGGTNSPGPYQQQSTADNRRPGSLTSSGTQCKWNQHLKYLLDDTEGANLFRRYAESEGDVHADRLAFYFACEGLKQQTDYATIKALVPAIYRLLRKCKLSVSEDLRERIKKGLASEVQLDVNIFNHKQLEIFHLIRETTYPHFLQSELYCQHIDSLAQTFGNAPMNYMHQPSPYREQPAVSSGPSSGSGSGCATIPRMLSTLHEDTEFSMSDLMPTMSSAGSMMDGPTCGKEKPQSRLTRDMLLATQDRRLEIRPQGAHGYTSKFSSSYNPVSRQDSGRQSCSSGSGMTDSDTMSVKQSRDGRTHHRRTCEDATDSDQPVHINPQTNSYVMVPRTSHIKSSRAPKKQDLLSILIPKLQVLERDRANEERLEQMMNRNDAGSVDGSRSIGGASGYRSGGLGNGQQGQALTEAIFKKLQPDDDNDQSILDQHVSRVWKDLTPHRSPGTISPCPDMQRMRSHDIGIGSDVSSIGSMRHSRSMPEHNSSRRLTNKWPSMNTDSGISMFSMEQPMAKSRESTSRSRPTMNPDMMSMDQPMVRPRESSSRTRPAMPTDDAAQLVEEARQRLADDLSRKSRRYPQYPPQVPPPVTASQEFTIAVYTFRDEELPYRSKLPGLHPTLRQFKDYLPKKGNFRFFFKTTCDDPDSPVIQEEIVNDTDVLPLFEGKVMGLVKPYE